MRSASQYDDDFREPVLSDPDSNRVGKRVRPELTVVSIPCQIRARDFQGLRMMASGDAPSSELILILHFDDLERLSLVDVDGNAALIPGDRLNSITTMTGVVEATFKTPPGLYLQKAVPRGWGLNMGGTPRRNLLRTTWSDRMHASPRFE